MKAKKTKWKVRTECVYQPDHEGQRQRAYAIITDDHTESHHHPGETAHVHSNRPLRKSIQ